MMSIFPFVILVFIGLANALPIPLSGTVLSIWLSEMGFERSSIGFYALLGLPFSLKILWSPVVDYVPLPFFSQSPRKGWLIFALLGIGLSLLMMGLFNPAKTPWVLGVSLLLLSLFSGCLYIVGISYELESLDEPSYRLGSACVVSGYRVGLLCAGAGGLGLAYLWGWSSMYLFMAFLLIVGSCLIFFSPEPQKSKKNILLKRKQFDSYPSLFRGFWEEVLLKPCELFFKKPDSFMILLLIVAFKCGDQFSKTMEGPFYLSLGFNKADLALAAKMWGFAFTIFGAFISGFFIKGKNPFISVGVTGCLHAITLLCNCGLALVGKSYAMLYMTVALENLTGGMAMAAFVYFLWRVSDKTHAAIQYTLLWSFFTFKGDIFAFLGAQLAAFTTWPQFFLIVSSLGVITSFAVIFKSRKLYSIKEISS